jgi:two-component system alkaline phosphatase synthesis response regulator PhoP
MMPRKNGVEVCEILRSQPAFKETVIVFLTALSDENSHIKGLEIGADDYISKPVSPKILVSRIHAIFRRINKEPEEKVIKIDNLEIDPVKFEAKVDNKAVVLAKKEFDAQFYSLLIVIFCMHYWYWIVRVSPHLLVYPILLFY